jgi:hypothetical protein
MPVIVGCGFMIMGGIALVIGRLLALVTLGSVYVFV